MCSKGRRLYLGFLDAFRRRSADISRRSCRNTARRDEYTHLRCVRVVQMGVDGALRCLL